MSFEIDIVQGKCVQCHCLSTLYLLYSLFHELEMEHGYVVFMLYLLVLVFGNKYVLHVPYLRVFFFFSLTFVQDTNFFPLEEFPFWCVFLWLGM